MSKDAVKQMFGKMEKDTALKTKYAQLMQAHQIETEKTLTEKLIEFGKTAGFIFSKENLMAARSELADKINENKELSDEDLSNVAGGDITRKQLGIIVSTAGVGVGCAILSVGATLITPKGCEQILSSAGDYCDTKAFPQKGDK